jgi:hypothetical protein
MPGGMRQSGRIVPVQTKVFFYTPPIVMKECDDTTGDLCGVLYRGPKSPIVTVDTDAAGVFSVELPPGEYSMFGALHGILPYSNLFGLKGKVGPISIRAGETLKQDIVINRGTD